MKRQTSKSDGFDPARRAALLKLGRFAVYTAPVMTTLLIGREVEAQQPGVCLTNPTSPACLNYCTRNPTDPACTVGSIGASPNAAKSSGEDFSYTPDPGTDDSGSSSDDSWNE